MDVQFKNPYLLPQTTLRSRLGRALWFVVYTFLFRPSPRLCYGWRALLLRCFGAKLGRNCHIYPKSIIWAPWNLQCEDGAAIADDAVIYNAAKVHLGIHAIVSQQAYLCTASHDIDNPAFPMTTAPISVGRYAWVGARACVLPGLAVRDGAVLGMGSVATRSLDAWHVYAGNPARCIRERERHVRAI